VRCSTSMTVPSAEETVLAASGPSVVAWNPRDSGAQHHTLEFTHTAPVYALGWLGKGKALAVAGEDCVVNIYSTEGKIVATAPKANQLPPNPPQITSVVTQGHNVVHGCSDGSIKVAKLPDIKVRSHLK
jgi:WD40 repeat protein